MITVEKILLEFDPEINNLLPVLEKISAVFGCVSQIDAGKAAEYFSVPLSKIYETASFYDSVNVKKQPLLVIRVCSGTHCSVSGVEKLVFEIENYFKIRVGDEFNPKVKLEKISCLGQCGEGPVMVVNGEVYLKVTASSVHDILGKYTG